MEIMKCILYGLCSIFVVSRLIDFFQKKDREISLPTAIPGLFYLMFFVFGALVMHNSSFMFFLLTVYLLLLSYTDIYTHQVYTLPGVIVFAFGIVALIFISHTLLLDLITVAVYGLFVFVLHKVKAYSMGDVEILIASCPYLLCLIPYGTIYVKLIFLFMVMFVVFTFTVLFAVVVSIKKKKVMKNVAMTPAIAVAIATVIFSLNNFRGGLL